jgi:hypothetical protein
LFAAGHIENVMVTNQTCDQISAAQTRLVQAFQQVSNPAAVINDPTGISKIGDFRASSKQHQLNKSNKSNYAN